ncbi:MAG: hypothetical protein KC800_00295 [Candidatus Eremiobacteraeota bacterium]|nr:hypothetical protein [Candidatus Eremiobacteraeota bacterium]
MDIIKQIYIQLPQQRPTFFGTYIKSGSECRFHPADPRVVVPAEGTLPNDPVVAKTRSAPSPFILNPTKSLYRCN